MLGTYNWKILRETVLQTHQNPLLLPAVFIFINLIEIVNKVDFKSLIHERYEIEIGIGEK